MRVAQITGTTYEISSSRSFECDRSGSRASFIQISNDELRAAIHYWENRLLGLSAIADPMTPEPDLWVRIERSLANPEPARARVSPFNRLWQNINFWRATSAVGLATSIVLAIATFLKPSNQTPFTVVLQSPEDRQVGWIVQGNPTNQVQVIPLAKTTVAPNQALQLWTKPNRAKVPTSLGLVPANRSVQIPADRLPGLEPGQLFEITLEPATGSPTGRPTGKILFIGRATVSDILLHQP